MNKISTLLLSSLLLLSLSLFSEEITRDQAKQVSRHFLFERINQHRQVPMEKLVIESVTPVMSASQLVYYVVNFQGDGFVLVAGDDQVSPILGYSFDGHFQIDNQPVQLTSWMEHYEKEILYHQEKQTKATAEISAEWASLQSDNPADLLVMSGKDIEPFVPCLWDQGKYYNDLCPSGVPVGCVATAMAQVMFYYRYPVHGTGSHSYNHATYGQQSANFGATTYSYDGMLNQLFLANYEVARLSYHCGVSVNMDYAPDGSGADPNNAAASLRNYFGYASNTQLVNRMSYSNTGWINLMHSNLDLKKPMIYSGNPSNGGAGHAWVCDGYQGTDFFHMNWGWSGASNGYYTVNDLNPSAVGTNFNSGHKLIINIYPGSNFPYQCSGQKVITQHTTGTIEDGSWQENYAGNNDCSWLIAPDDSVTSIKLKFHRFDTEPTNDYVTVYGGETTGAPVLGTYSGTTVPADIIVNGSKVLITFHSDDATNAQGFYLTYSSTYPDFCSSGNLTALSGTITDGSGPKKYQANSTCIWIIQPTNAASVKLTFTEFETEPVYDYVKVYDLNTEELLATYSGSTLPDPVMTQTGGMYIEFRTNGLNNYQGWTANYQALGTGINELSGFNGFSFYPNPATDRVQLRFTTAFTQDISVQITTLEGKVLLTDNKRQYNGEFNSTYDISSLAKGVYLLKVSGQQDLITKKLIIQ
ncbi:MAG: C10 family peptidase [Bacteroidetes bacterium]|nr:C10 family peptidase [Bacteroidota bacterium]